jgi:Sortase domain
VATRIVIASRDIDLPIISRDRKIRNQGPDKYPPCDVALYHTAFEQPGEAGTAYIYAHARAGMFLPLLEASQRQDGASLIGDLVQVYTSDDREHVFQITQVKRHALDFSLALDAPPGSQQLILQTSEGPRGTVPKLQVLAEPVDVLDVSDREANPRPHPRACYDTP